MEKTWRELAEAQASTPGALSYPFASLETMARAAREDAIAWLLERARAGDALAVETLGLVGETRALPAIDEALAAKAGGRAFQLAASRARWRLSGTTDEAEARLLSLLELSRVGGADARIDAVATLAESPHPASWPLLIAMLSDADQTVRFHAFSGLCKAFDIRWRDEARASRMAVANMRLYTRLSTVWGPEARALAAGFQRLVEGASRQDADLGTGSDGQDPVVEVFFDALRASKPLPMARAGELSDPGRTWLVALIEARLNLAAPEAPAQLASLARNDTERSHFRDVLVEARALARGLEWDAMIVACDEAIDALVPGPK